MPAVLAGPLGRLRSALETISLGQKVVIGLLVAALGLGGFFFYNWITTPTMAPLFSNLASSDASAIVEELNADGTSYELADGGQTILVAQDQVYDLRLAMSGKGLPAGNDTGYALLDEQGITTSEFQQQKTYQRAHRGRAGQHPRVPGRRPAGHRARGPARGRGLRHRRERPHRLGDARPGSRHRSCPASRSSRSTNLVSSSIEGMSPEQVTVSDTSGQLLSAAGQGVTAAAGDARSQVETDYENRLAANAQSHPGPRARPRARPGRRSARTST